MSSADKRVPHTTGEWRVETVSDAARVVVGEGRSKVILARLAPQRIPERETVANAHLMAAAPDLLNALRVCVEQLSPSVVDVVIKPGVEPYSIKLARAAIVKAERDDANLSKTDLAPWNQ